MKHLPIILGIESSCDDTAAALIQNGHVLSNIIISQKIHQKYGGVVPELASRSHQRNIIPVVDRAVSLANIMQNQIDAIAFTRGPGLMGSLLVGTSFAKSLAMALGVPLIGVHHMQAHVLIHFIKGVHRYPPRFPFLCLTVSGGHTQIVRVDDFFEMTVLGHTIDDAAGEAFDKMAKILGLDYPGGPLINRYARNGDPRKFIFSKPKVEGLDFSFSGLKTHILYFIRDGLKSDPGFVREQLPDLCAAVQWTIVQILLEKVERAVEKTGVRYIALAGGVSANTELRKQFSRVAAEKSWQIYLPKIEYTTDNAAMIAMVGQLKYERQWFDPLDITPFSRYDRISL
ncbi:MAG: tRNA (adenosine(37)-N6)-threonylcarbamoyltransferase complex transferase subunit TsaD [Flavobacteriales bacterium AspAUS03]